MDLDWPGQAGESSCWKAILVPICFLADGLDQCCRLQASNPDKVTQYWLLVLSRTMVLRRAVAGSGSGC